MRKKVIEIIVITILVSSLLVFWEWIVQTKNIPKYILPKPSDIAAYLKFEFFEPHRIGYESIIFKSLSSLRDAAIGFVTTIILGTVIGVSFSRFESLYKAFFPIVFVTQLLPLPAFAPLVAAFFGYGFATKIFIIVVFTIFPVIVGAYRAIKAISPLHTSLLRVYNANFFQRAKCLFFPHLLPTIVINAKILTVASFSAAIISELSLTTSSGIGKDIYTSFNNQVIPRVWSSIFVISIISLTLYFALSKVEKVILEKLYLHHYD